MRGVVEYVPGIGAVQPNDRLNSPSLQPSEHKHLEDRTYTLQSVAAPRRFKEFTRELIWKANSDRFVINSGGADELAINAKMVSDVHYERENRHFHFESRGGNFAFGDIAIQVVDEHFEGLRRLLEKRFTATKVHKKGMAHFYRFSRQLEQSRRLALPPHPLERYSVSPIHDRYGHSRDRKNHSLNWNTTNQFQNGNRNGVGYTRGRNSRSQDWNPSGGSRDMKSVSRSQDRNDFSRNSNDVSPSRGRNVRSRDWKTDSPPADRSGVDADVSNRVHFPVSAKDFDGVVDWNQNAVSHHERGLLFQENFEVKEGLGAKLEPDEATSMPISNDDECKNLYGRIGSHPKELKYSTGEIVRINDAVIRLLSHHELQEWPQISDKLKSYDGPFKIIKIADGPSSNEDISKAYTSAGDKTPKKSQSNLGNARLHFKPGEGVVKLDFPNGSKARTPWTSLSRLRPVYGINRNDTCGKGVQDHYQKAKKMGEHANISNIILSSPNESLYICRLGFGSFIEIPYVAVAALSGSGVVEGEKKVERLQEKRTDPMTVRHLQEQEGHLLENKVLGVQYLVHWAGWPSEDDTWERAHEKIPHQFVDEFHVDTSWFRHESTGEPMNRVEIFSQTPRQAKKKLRADVDVSVAVHKTCSGLPPSPFTPKRKPSNIRYKTKVQSESRA